MSDNPFASKTIPPPGQLPNYKADALQVFEAMQAGGCVVIPTEYGYGYLASSKEAIEKSFAGKKRRPGHGLGIVGNYDAHRQLHTLDERSFDMIRVFTQDMNLGVGVVGPYKQDHPLMQRLHPDTVQKNLNIKDGKLGIFVGGSPLLKEVVRLNLEVGKLCLGTSANVSGAGQKFRIEDVEDEIKESADIIVDYGLQRFHLYGVSSPIIDFSTMTVIRRGAGYELFADMAKRFWGVELKEPDP